MSNFNGDYTSNNLKKVKKKFTGQFEQLLKIKPRNKSKNKNYPFIKIFLFDFLFIYMENKPMIA